MPKLKLSSLNTIIDIAFVTLIIAANTHAVHAEVKRLVSTTLDLSKPYKIYLTYDLVSSVKFPLPITEAKVGNADAVKVLISKTLSSELSLKLTTHLSTPTNLIVRCSKKVFVIDIIPSKSIHQDYIKITGSFSDPDYENNMANLIASSINAAKSKSYEKKELIDSSERYLR